ncbi:DUF1289 domain-containing protein [Rheinheimera sp. UJ51]|uniref:DUF1289 domain-containing protein n=1 Tax=Rheinheimera sp. UJ51 TaxID=2892446 RepID=UPI001E4EE670|nr:DUF1289 domain-containing protein [Rheinheimera sp. UJ51]MCC5450555.1 DUF1289 domain-containing protein [Rheinheimera sp. UJ51]
MDQLELFDIPNPCIGVCQSNNRGYCLGCLRSREERFNWPQKPANERSQILRLLAQRRARLKVKALSAEPEVTPAGSLDLF